MKTFFEAHIWPLKNKLFRMAYLWVKDKEVAEDILQSVFEKAWIREKQLQTMENPTGWMVRSLKNESLQHYKSSKRVQPLGENEYAAEESEEPDRTAEIKLVMQFLDSLPEKHREIFQLREMEGLTYEEIAMYLEISIEQVKVNLFRARKSLRAFLLQVHER